MVFCPACPSDAARERVGIARTDRAPPPIDPVLRLPGVKRIGAMRNCETFPEGSRTRRDVTNDVGCHDSLVGPYRTNRVNKPGIAGLMVCSPPDWRNDARRAVFAFWSPAAIHRCPRFDRRTDLVDSIQS